MRLARDERGTAAAEFAVVVPAALLLIAFTVSALTTVSLQVRIEQAAAHAARLASRGDDASRAAAGLADARVGVHREGDLVCADVQADPPLPLLPTLRATSCALAGGL